MKFHCPLCQQTKDDGIRTWEWIVISLGPFTYNRNHGCEECLLALQLKEDKKLRIKASAWKKERDNIIRGRGSTT